MATEVLRPQDVLVERFRVHTTSYARRRNFPVKPQPTSSASNQNQQRRLSTKHEKKRSDAAAAEAKKPNHGGDRRRRGEIGSGALAMGQVTLLRRGESLDSLATKLEDSNPRDPIVEDPAAVRARSDSELVLPKKVRKAPPPPPAVDSYAGAAFESSPSPRCLPQPSFLNKKGGEDELFVGGATRSLRRMLRLE